MTVVYKVIAVVLLTVVLLASVCIVMRWAGLNGYDPYWIDYNRPGVDITSEGPGGGVPWTRQGVFRLP